MSKSSTTSSVSETSLQIKSPAVINKIRTIKQIQSRMKDPDVRNLEYVRVYDKLSREFDDFFSRYTSIFIKVIRGETLDVLAAALYYQDQVLQGLISEEEVAGLVAGRFLTPEQKAESDARLAEMKKNGEL